MTQKELITDIVKKIKRQFRPQRIILFGSYVWGKPSADSDIDLFVVMDSNLRRDERARQILKIFPERLFPLDIIVYTPKEVEQSLQRGNPFIKEILSEGGMLYG